MSDLAQAASYLEYASMMFMRCFGYTIIPLGTVGHLLNFYVFTRPTLRPNPCARYFLAASIFSMLNTCVALPIRLVQSGYVNTDPGAYSLLFCKLSWFIIFSLR